MNHLRNTEAHIKTCAPASVDRYRAEAFDQFYAQQDAEHQALLDTWIATLTMGREKFGTNSAKSLLASVIVFVHERPSWKVTE